MLAAAERRLLQGGLQGLQSVVAAAAIQLQQSRGNLVPVSCMPPLPAPQLPCAAPPCCLTLGHQGARATAGGHREHEQGGARL